MSAKIGFFCSPIGLGHATRDVAVASLFDQINMKFVTGAAAARLISEYGFDVQDLYRPPRFDVRDGNLQKSLKWLWQYYQYYRDCKKIAAEFIRKERPDLIVSDEDFASLSVAQEKKIPTVLITDILQTSFTRGVGSIIERKMNRAMQKMIQKCDTVILPELGSDEGNIRRVGPIVRQTTQTREHLRQTFSFTKKTVLVSVGGTDAGRFLIDRAAKASKKLADVEFVIVSGPSIQADCPGMRSMGFVNNLHAMIYAADVVVSLAGKSTIDEAKAYGTPGIFIPIRNHFEQEDNARNEGYTYDDISRLEELILQKMDEPRKQEKSEGATKCWEIIKRHTMTNT